MNLAIIGTRDLPGSPETVATAIAQHNLAPTQPSIKTMKKFFIQYKIRFAHGESAEGDMTAYWGGTSDGLVGLKEEIKRDPQFGGRQILYVEIRTMIECFGDPIK